MRSQSVALCLFLQASAARAGGSTVSVAYGVQRPDGRDLKLLGTDPEVDIFYDGTTATCDPDSTGRRFDASKSTDPLCPTDPDSSWELTFQVDGGSITLLSCAADKVLKISSANAEGFSFPAPLTPGDRNFLVNNQKDIVLQPRYEEKLSLEAQSAKFIELLLEWPSFLPFEYTLDSAAEWDYQRDVTIYDDSEDSLVVHNKPPESVSYDDLYQSLCFTSEDKYVQDSGLTITSKLDMSPACSPPDGGMLAGATMDSMTCQALPIDPVANNWASGDCMGRCGGGCGYIDAPPMQFTNDCLDYDLCLRMGIDRVWEADCVNEFLFTIDDTIWSGNCDLETKMEAKLDPCAEEAVPVAAPTPAPQALFVPRPVLVTVILEGSCTTVCANTFTSTTPAGTWECTFESLSEQAWRFKPSNIQSETLYGVGLPGCDSIEPAIGSDDPTAPYFEVGNFNCVASLETRADSTFDCDAVAMPGHYRYCTCYLA